MSTLHLQPAAQPAWLRARRAFTLLELVVVLAIIAIVSAIAAPRYAGATQRFRADVAARRVASDLLYVRNSARAASRSYSVVFDVPGSSYSVSGLADPQRGGSNYVVALGSEPYACFLASASFGGGGTLTFNGYGRPSAAGSAVLQSGSQRRRITVDGESGDTTITVEGG